MVHNLATYWGVSPSVISLIIVITQMQVLYIFAVIWTGSSHVKLFVSQFGRYSVITMHLWALYEDRNSRLVIIRKHQRQGLLWRKCIMTKAWGRAALVTTGEMMLVEAWSRNSQMTPSLVCFNFHINLTSTMELVMSRVPENTWQNPVNCFLIVWLWLSPVSCKSQLEEKKKIL